MNIRNILAAKGGRVVTIEPDRTVLDASRLLVKESIGGLVVTEGDAVVGMITERDILRLAASNPDALSSTAVRERMTSGVISGLLDDDVRKVMDLMTRHRFRHLPVLDRGRLAGLISIGDVINALLRETVSENEQMRAYIQGTV